MIPNTETIKLVQSRSESQDAELRRYLTREWQSSRMEAISFQERKMVFVGLRAAVRYVASMIL